MKKVDLSDFAHHRDRFLSLKNHEDVKRYRETGSDNRHPNDALSLYLEACDYLGINPLTQQAVC